MQCVLEKINNSLDPTKEKISEFEHKAIEAIQNEKQMQNTKLC